MKKNVIVYLPALVLWLALVPPAQAQVGAAEASGNIMDQDGNPVQGAVVTFVPQGNPTLKYTGTTNKKGRYFVPGLWTPKEGDRWDILIEAADVVPVHIRVESRNVNKVLIGDILDSKLSLKSKIPEIMIRPMGHAQVDFTLAPRSALEQAALDEARAQAEASGQAVVSIGEDGVRVEVTQQDPWSDALTLAQSGDLRGSVPLFDKAIEEQPDKAERHEGFAKVLYQIEDYDRAIEQAGRAVELAPERLDSHMVLYSAHVARGEFEQGRSALEAARVQSPEDIRVLGQLAYVAGRLDDRAGEIAANQAIVKLQPDNADAWLSLGSLYAKAGDATRSEEAYRRVGELNPESAHTAFFNVGAQIMNRRSRTKADTQRAVDAFRQAVTINSEYAQAHRELAFALLELGDRAGAKASLEAYVRAQPDAPDAAGMKGLIQTLDK